MVNVAGSSESILADSGRFGPIRAPFGRIRGLTGNGQPAGAGPFGGYADSAAPARTFRSATTWIASATAIDARNAGPIPITGRAGCSTT